MVVEYSLLLIWLANFQANLFVSALARELAKASSQFILG
jgi:hypothetical protein